MVDLKWSLRLQSTKVIGVNDLVVDGRGRVGILKIYRARTLFNLRITILAKGAIVNLGDDINISEIARFLIDGVDLLRRGCFRFCPIHLLINCSLNYKLIFEF